MAKSTNTHRLVSEVTATARSKRFLIVHVVASSSTWFMILRDIMA